MTKSPSVAVLACTARADMTMTAVRPIENIMVCPAFKTASDVQVLMAAFSYFAMDWS